MKYSTLDRQVEQGIFTLRLNRPDKTNAFSIEMIDESVDAFHACRDDVARARMVTGARNLANAHWRIEYDRSDGH